MASVEEHIKKAMEQGKFDNLPGAGKPLRLEENPWEDPEWSMAYHILQNAGIPLPWIATRKEIEAEMENARAGLKRTWDWKQAQEKRQPKGFIEDTWRRALEAFNQQVSAINQRIQSYNLEAPGPQFHLYPVDATREIAQLTGQNLSDTL